MRPYLLRLKLEKEPWHLRKGRSDIKTKAPNKTTRYSLNLCCAGYSKVRDYLLPQSGTLSAYLSLRIAEVLLCLLPSPAHSTPVLLAILTVSHSTLSHFLFHKLIKPWFGPVSWPLFHSAAIVLAGTRTSLVPHHYRYIFIFLILSWVALEVEDWNCLLVFQ